MTEWDRQVEISDGPGTYVVYVSAKFPAEDFTDQASVCRQEMEIVRESAPAALPGRLRS